MQVPRPGDAGATGSLGAASFLAGVYVAAFGASLFPGSFGRGGLCAKVGGAKTALSGQRLRIDGLFVIDDASSKMKGPLKVLP